ncbi:MAG: 50S ribosome-binding GTPase [Planctomycetaceae bacterium]|nr:50S ribosome-binding GTPase [Planctomycetaceae bacterium]
MKPEIWNLELTQRMPTERTSSPELETLSVATRRLAERLTDLESRATMLRLAPLQGREWYELLRQKLVPQLGRQAWLVVAVVGGTNIGKSVVFNHLAGARASASSPLASGTRHPVCLVPAGFAGHHDLQSIYPDFQLRQWAAPEEALQESDQSLLFWREAAELPSNLLVLDTPDIDSDARINWQRADAVRRCADVLIAVLTQQKYNDAAVKDFFRKAAAEDKCVIVIFNQCQLPDDEPYWPVWVRTFCEETGVQPESVYLAPNDRAAANELRLPFYLRAIVNDAESDTASSQPGSQQTSRDLRTDLADLRFQEIRVRTLMGSVAELLHPQRGVTAWMQEIRLSAEELSRTAERLSAETVLRIRNWPSPANNLVVREIRSWWQAHQVGWARQINRIYNTVGSGVLWPLKAIRNAVQGEPIAPMVEYREREWSAILSFVEDLYDKLQWMAESGNDVIRPRIEQILSGQSRTQLLAGLREAHDRSDFDAELSAVVHQQMQRFQQDSPEMFRFYRQLNNVSAAVRPMTSVVLFTLGFGPAGDAVAHFAANAATQAVVHVVADVAGGATAAVAGEAAVSSVAGSGTGLLQAWFHDLHAAFTAKRAGWLTEMIHRQVLGSLPEDLQAAAALANSDVFLEVQELVGRLQTSHSVLQSQI